MPIQLLPPQLANQIAAGEVVERPSAVVKELVENSLDAGATQIEIEIERGGLSLMRIRDNGCGIDKEELSLALARHATSKISSLEDLQAIKSQGFRGEALASISAVSRLTLTSRTATQAQAWQVYAEGRDRVTTIKPASHPPGSTVEVLDLFYNTPARRKFMRTEKTEFAHIDEVIRRVALARFNVTIILHHNGKRVRQYRAADPDNQSQHERRLTGICGPVFLQHALSVDWQHGDLAINGWISRPDGVRIPGEIHYFYVNKRIVRDKIISHAIQQAHQDQMQAGQQLAYILYLEIDPHQVDVNVHPAKHEVRFYQARLVHDFIYQAVVKVLQQFTASHMKRDKNALQYKVCRQPDNRLAAGCNKYSQPYEPSPPALSGPSEMAVTAGALSATVREHVVSRYYSDKPYQKQQGELYRSLLQTREIAANKSVASQTESSLQQTDKISLQSPRDSFGRVLTIYPPCYALIEYQDDLALIALTVAARLLKQAQFIPPTQGLCRQPLLIPLKLILNASEIAACVGHQALLNTMGIDLVIEHKRAMLCAVPLPLRQQNLQKLIPAMLTYLSQHQDISPEILAIWMADQFDYDHRVFNLSQAIQLLTDLERLCPQWVQHPPAKLLQYVDIQAVIAMLNT